MDISFLGQTTYCALCYLSPDSVKFTLRTCFVSRLNNCTLENYLQEIKNSNATQKLIQTISARMQNLKNESNWIKKRFKWTFVFASLCCPSWRWDCKGVCRSKVGSETEVTESESSDPIGWCWSRDRFYAISLVRHFNMVIILSNFFYLVLQRHQS